MKGTPGTVYVALPTGWGSRVDGALADLDADVAIHPPESLDELDELGTRFVDQSVRCLIASNSPHGDVVATVEAVRSQFPALPVVAVLRNDTDSSAAALTAGASEIVDASGTDGDWLHLLAHRVRAVLATNDAHLADRPSADAPLDPTVQANVDRLHELAAELDEQSHESDIGRVAINAASEMLRVNACTIAEAIDDTFVPLAATTSEPRPGRPRLETNDGLAGLSYARGDTILVDNASAYAHAETTDAPYSSVLTVPIDGYGVFQAAATKEGVYDAGDRELAEVLVTYLEHALTRVQYEQRLTRQRDKAAALFQNIPDAAVEYVLDDGVPRIEAVNSAFVRLFGYEPADAIGETTLSLLVADAEEPDATELYEEIHAGEFTDREISRETVDGSAPFLLRHVPIANTNDTSRGYLIYTDIGPLVERERELQAQNERLDAFASMVSHDLRNPLSAAHGYVDLARETGNDEHLDVVQDEHDRMFQMIDDLLALARQGEAVGDTEPVDLTAVVHGAWSTVDTADATLDRGDELPTVEGDSQRLQQLFENLFRNAIMHGGDDVTVTVGTDENGFYVADDGSGIPDHEKDAVLEMGMTTAKGEGGTGFGLAIVSEVADGHGWSVTVMDSASGGARFEFDTGDAPTEPPEVMEG